MRQRFGLGVTTRILPDGLLDWIAQVVGFRHPMSGIMVEIPG